MATTFASPPLSISREAPAPRPLRTARYTIDGSDALENHLEQSCELVKEALLSRLPPGSVEGLLLGGGYGRGEGGVLRSGSDHPYNDLEFYLFVRGNRHLFEHHHLATLHAVAHDLAPAIGLEVEFKVLTLEALRRAPISMFFYDMVAGHKWLTGSDDLLHGCDHHRAAHLLPVSEATRLLMNRCSGLLLAREQLAEPSFRAENADFIRRNIAKAQLAFGDAILAAFGRYHWSCRERHKRLQSLAVPLPWRTELVEHHRRGVEFKLHPFRSEERQLDDNLTAAIAFARDVWLWLEGQRLQHAFISARHYATSRLPKWPESHSMRNALLNLKLFRHPVMHRPLRHPRERILESLALLLWEPLALADSTLRDRLHANLDARVMDRAAAVRRYRELWPRVS